MAAMSLDAVQSQRQRSAPAAGPMTQVMGRRFMVSAGHPLAAQAAASILSAGGASPGRYSAAEDGQRR